MAEDINKELLKLKVRIGNSFLRAFYPIDYRSNQNLIRNIDSLLDKETLGLRTLASTTSQLNVKIGRILTGINSELDEMQRSLDGLEGSIQTGDDVLGSRIDQLEKATSSLLDFLGAAGGYEAIRRLREARKKGKGTKGGPPPPTQPGDDADQKKKGKYKLPKGMGIIGLAWGLWTLWDELQTLDPNMKKEEYKQAVYTIISKAVASMGLMWVGAFLGAMIGGAIGLGVGAIPGFIAGLVGGAVADYALGDTVDQLVEEVVDYLYTGDEEEEAAAAEEEGPPPLSDSTIQQREEAPAPELQTPEQQVSEQASDIQALVAPPIPGPTPPAPPMEQTIAGPVDYPGPVPPVDLQPFAPAADESARAKAAAAEAAGKSQLIVNTTAASNPTVAEQLYGGDQQQTQITDSPVSDNKASITTSSNQAGGIQPSESVSGNVKVVEAYGPRRPGRPMQEIRDVAVRAAEAAGMSQITFTSGLGDWISPERRAKGQKTTRHALGDALDVTGFESPTQRVAFMRAARQMGAGGIGAYGDGSVHIDLGPQRTWDKAKGIPGLAEGGKVSKPTLALIGEAGEPEYVVPQSKAIKFAHEMVAARPTYRTKKHTHLLVVPIMT